MELGWYWLTWVAGYLWGVASAWALAWRVAAAMAQRAAFRAIRRFAEARMRIAVMSAAEEGYTEEQLFEMLDDVFGEQQKDGQK